MTSIHKLSIFFCAIFCLSISAAPAAGAGADVKLQEIIAKMRLHWTKRVDTFRAENATLKRGPSDPYYTVFLGDSLTEGFDLAKYFPGHLTLNRGIISDHIGIGGDQGVLQRLDVSVADCHTSRVILLIGVNDLADYVRAKADPETSRTLLLAGHKRLVEKIRACAPAGTEVVLVSLFPSGGRYTPLLPEIRAYNEGLKALAAELKCPYWDVHSLLTDDKGALRADFTHDGLHLLPPAYEILAREYRRHLGWE